MNTINRPSFFKLPFIFISVFFIIFFGLMYGFLLIQSYANSYLPDNFLSKQIIMSLAFNLSTLLLFFIATIFFCQKFRLYSIADFGIKVALIGLIFALCYFGIKIIYQVVIYSRIFILIISSTELFMSLSQIGLWLTLISKLASLIIFIISIFLLYLLFLLFAKTNVTKQQSYILEGLTGSRIYAHVFSSLMLLFIALFWTDVVYPLFYRILFELNDGSYLIVLFAFLLLMVLYYAIFYFAARNRFTKIDSSIKFGKLLITVIITIIFTLIVPIFYQIMIFVKLFSDNLISGYISFILIHFIFCFCSSRLSVKIMYH
ncbi:hypothetical protein [uncultured Gilliamella sp.]|uniref:hypothetical protein n=1 Tax=uncultured Gilliamella sp. TaxID=1193505 RepID=UPI0025ED1374|nr:hypothetical protein [uncultured Gilliamella sp.]